jgi:hypothetical protein
MKSKKLFTESVAVEDRAVAVKVTAMVALTEKDKEEDNPVIEDI